MNDRDFSDTIKFETVKKNLNKNNGSILCEACGRKIISLNECHFDHIKPYAKGGKSIADNCQILCVECNLKKKDKNLNDYLLEEKARRFLSGELITDTQTKNDDEINNEKNEKITKELFDKVVGEFIKKNGNISKTDFSREYNRLPSVHYVRVYYGSMNEMKRAFGINDLSYNWNRSNIEKALSDFVAVNGDIFQKDLNKANNLPSLPCILRYFPEYKSFSEVKNNLLNLDVPLKWTKEDIVEKGNEFIRKNGKICQADLNSKNGLPSIFTINKVFGSLANYRFAIGTSSFANIKNNSNDEFAIAVNDYFKGKERIIDSQKSFFETFPYSKSDIVKKYGTFSNFCNQMNIVVLNAKKDFISKEEIASAVDSYFSEKERIIESYDDFFNEFEISPSTISKRYGTFSNFSKANNITVLKSKKSKYTKREVDDLISKWIRNGNSIPATGKELVKLGLPSKEAIMKFYENWREPFYIYKKIYEEVQRDADEKRAL